MSFHTRSKSDQLPNLTIEIPHLETILSDREMVVSSETPKVEMTTRVDRRKKRLSKSLSELEFEEVKGFIDLGFVFSEDDVDSDLAEIVPGLQKLGHKTESFDRGRRENVGERERPYLSEAWELRQKEEKALMKWRIPAARNEMEMKDSLKFWAHTVASAVR